MSDESSFSEQEKGPGGAPTKYDESYVEGIVEFFESYPRYREVEEHTYNKDGQVIHTKVVQKPLTPPTYYAYANHLGVCMDTLKNWTREHPAFDAAYKKCKSLQAGHIVENSMEGIAPTAFAIFMMKNNHGWTDKVESKVEQKVTLEDMVSSSFEGPDGEKQ